MLVLVLQKKNVVTQNMNQQAQGESTGDEPPGIEFESISGTNVSILSTLHL